MPAGSAEQASSQQQQPIHVHEPMMHLIMLSWHQPHRPFKMTMQGLQRMGSSPEKEARPARRALSSTQG